VISVVEARRQRRLAAILVADVAGYSHLMAAEEEGTLSALQEHIRAFVEPLIARFAGRIVKTTGDGLLVEFASVERPGVSIGQRPPGRGRFLDFSL